MSIADKITALFNALTREEVDAMPPIERRRFADLCRHWANFADLRPRGQTPQSGVLADLKRGLRMSSRLRVRRHGCQRQRVCPPPAPSVTKRRPISTWI